LLKLSNVMTTVRMKTKGSRKDGVEVEHSAVGEVVVSVLDLMKSTKPWLVEMVMLLMLGDSQIYILDARRLPPC
jgi:hypothetical protein